MKDEVQSLFKVDICIDSLQFSNKLHLLVTFPQLLKTCCIMLKSGKWKMALKNFVKSLQSPKQSDVVEACVEV